MLPHSLLLLLGSGEREAELRQRAQKLNIASKVIFLGVRSDVADILSASDFFVLSSFAEGFGISALEAQANGLPCFLSSGVPPPWWTVVKKYISQIFRRAQRSG